MAEKQLLNFKVDEPFELFVLLKGADVRTAKNGKQFIHLTFEDQSGELAGNLWDASETDVATYVAGKVVFVRGQKELYQGNPQLKIMNLRAANAGEPNDPAEFIAHGPMSRQEMETAVSKIIFDITNPTWNRVVRTLLQRHADDFYSFPAAKKNHHAFAGGLAYHTISIVRLAKTVADLHPNIDRSLLYAGAMLHDLGKTVELSGPVSTTYTLAGNLIGHIVLIDEEIVNVCVELNFDPESEDMILLRHMILAHHGLLEYGSPVRPHLLEAEVLHDLDELDASIQMMTTAVEHTNPGDFSERIFGMDGRNFYKPLDETDRVQD
ncbi:3'-5' exoribonuclease YhaM family protein [Furfurilactobacillus siliginis]|uniref:3'-5' exoribonuclease YhaM n=1 Tax=Furfurilactobacillus siliginis TaxID=348151 RepID=A0A0R2L5I6_9LACO|nr:HD domain-containing protein [Furfurilactobacillus siliginis]KRN94716.1 HD-superfamily hydrolase [Furfurilactobacillus siliginis]GEK29483.1 3'-5' exoribonuclease YhaM [Furfurilactobacillus siliginis]